MHLDSVPKTERNGLKLEFIAKSVYSVIFIYLYSVYLYIVLSGGKNSSLFWHLCVLYIINMYNLTPTQK